MTLPNRPHNATPLDANPNVTPSSQLTNDEIAAIRDAEYQHVDYDLHPLKVQGLEHYIDSPAWEQRFHIW
ncbi:hypothetical protein DVT68_12385 [Dyella solisilvae]|uniref:Uncharacterized protein n=1 Tax=Dyella solisilvae TaxID=1920168 RepID=A0A370K5H1_9GAMM|nr:hypothetical protein [Dyella solisilvae]RDI97893.1 hypothetical protein DVT68_12385 [Dyella solisilvae]